MSFRLAHLSDLHLSGSEDERQMVEGLFQSLLDYDVDHILVTGDISQDGNADAFRILDEVRREYGFGPARSTVLPGNHDYPGRRSFARRFGLGAVQVRDLDGGRVRLVGLDSTARNVGVAAHFHNVLGSIETFQLTALEAALARRPKRKVAKVVALHHFVLPVPDSSPQLDAGMALRLWGPLEEADDLLDVVGTGGARLVLTGHSHVKRVRSARRSGEVIRCIVGGQTLSGVDGEMVGYAVYDFSRGALISEGWVNLCDACFSLGSIECGHCETGELECEACNSAGAVVCSDCEGTGALECDACEGDGNLWCVHCDGYGCGWCRHTGTRECRECAGYGEFYCAACSGAGECDCEDCEGAGVVTCGECDGNCETQCSACR